MGYHSIQTAQAAGGSAMAIEQVNTARAPDPQQSRRRTEVTGASLQ